jgi:hypothetical protein
MRVKCLQEVKEKARGNNVDLQLAGKKALVTGSSSEPGEAIVKLLAAEGVMFTLPPRPGA